jgi:glucokinase
VRGGLDLGGTKIQAVIAGVGARVLGEARRETPREGGPEAVAGELAAALRDAAADAEVELEELATVGVGAPGLIDEATGSAGPLPNVAGWDEAFPLAHVLGNELGVRVVVTNDVAAAVEAELRFGAGRGLGSFLGVFWGTGVGGSVVLDGRLWRGRGAAGELGHVVAKPGGRRCGCGRRGCVEAYAGRGPLEERARKLARRHQTVLFEIQQERGRPRLTSGVWHRALEQHDRLAERLLERAVEALGVGVGSALNLLDVEAVILGGGLGLKLGEPWLERIREAVLPHLLTSSRPAEFRMAALGDHGGALGAALLSADRYDAAAR